MKRNVALSACLLCTLFAAVAVSPRTQADEPPDYDSNFNNDRPSTWNFSTPEDQARPGLKFYYYAVEALKKKQYGLAVDMYEASASWAYKPSAYNLGVMYLQGDGVPVDRSRAMAWMAIAAERGDDLYVQARELIYADLSKEEFKRANEIWRELKKTYGDDVAMERARMRWAQVRSAMTGSPVGSPGALRVGAASSAVRVPVMDGSGTRSMVTGANTTPGGILGAAQVDGAIAYRQLVESRNPYDPKFEREPVGTATVGPIEPVKQAGTSNPNDGSQPRRY